jgi:hypothetical protein
MNLLSKSNRQQKRLAFTLIDAAVGMGVLGIVLISLFASFTFGFSLTKLYREELRATQILQEKTEAIRLYTWFQITNNTKDIPRSFKESHPSNGTNNSVYFAGTVEFNPKTITNTTYSGELREVLVSVTWTNKIKRTRSTRTFVSNYGLQNSYLIP